MIAAHRIKFGNFSSKDFDLICDVAFDEDSGETDVFLNREAVASENYNGTFYRVHNYKYQDVFTPTFSFVKKNFEAFTFNEQRRILTWLTSKSTASFLTVYQDDSDVISFECLGGWTEIQTYKNANNATIGIVATFESLFPWALSPLHTITQDVSDPANSTIAINIETDEPESAVYPRITIQQHALTSVVKINHAMTDTDRWIENTVYYYNGTNKYYWVDSNGVKHTSSTNDSSFETTSVTITNTYTNNNDEVAVFDTIVKNNIKGEKIVLDGANRIVSSSRTIGRIFGDDFDFEWIPLYDGSNELSFVGNCAVTIEYRYPIKIGQF